MSKSWFVVWRLPELATTADAEGAVRLSESTATMGIADRVNFFFVVTITVFSFVYVIGGGGKFNMIQSQI
jgi:hypothetical protein